ncbi:hypothetical protein R1sor_016780 [Riccia sorocarpa]|uniref:Transposase n=1 Tax=Riccia sorocarpa TaxID=122646 RepID=A0ABD3HHZ9_9MARC
MEARIDGRVGKAGKSVRGSTSKISSSEAAMVRHEKSPWRWNGIAGVAKGQLALRSFRCGSVARTFTKVHRECNRCFSSRQTTRLYEPAPAHPNVDLIASTCKYEELSHIASVAFRDAAIVDMPVYQHWAVDCSEEFITALSTWEDHENPRELFKKWAEDVLRVEVETGNGLYWELRTWEGSATRPNEFVATLRCACRQDRVSVNRQNSLANPRASEKRWSIQRFRCQGELHVAEAGMRTADVYRLLRLQDHIDPEKITRAKVNYWVAEIESWRYGAGEPDQMKSSKDFIDRPENTVKGFEMLLYEDNDDFQAISFLTSFWRYVSTVKEVLTDSTFKTNDMRFEMFALIGNLGGFGVPLCYLFYLKKTIVDEATPSVTQPRGCRKGLLYDWMCKLREKGLRPAFFITDKDAGQIEAAQRAIPEMHVQLCLKHCLDAIERRMVALDRGTNPYEPSAAHTVFPFIDPTWGPSVGDSVTGSICPPEYRASVKIFVAQHFNMHPLIPDLSGTERPAAELHELAVYEAYMFCHERGLHRFWAYLWNEWYSPDMWKLFSRSAKPLLRMSRTTNLVEVHWRKIKHDYLNALNRPRLDRLVYLLAKKVVGDVEISLKQFQKGREFPTWWVKFRKLGYKEQVSTEVPVFLQTYRRFEPPFYVFQSKEEFFSRQTMRPESDPWYNHPLFAEHGLPEDPANDLPEDHGVGNFDLNEAEDPANGFPEGHGVRLFDLNEAAEEVIGDDNIEPEVHAEPNVAAIARHLAEVNVGGDDESGEEEQADPDRQAYEVMVRVLQQTFDDARLYALGSSLPR